MVWYELFMSEIEYYGYVIHEKYMRCNRWDWQNVSK